PLVPGFGDPADAAVVRVEEEDRRSADDRLRRYDRNGDGVLDRDELGRGRWPDDPFEFDRNRDGKLTRDELAMRYAKRRVAQQTERQGGANAPQVTFYNPAAESGSAAASGEAGQSGGDLDPRMSRIVDFMMSRYDRNGNKVLEKSE